MRKIRIASKIIRVGGQIVFWMTVVGLIALTVFMLFLREIPEGVHFQFDQQTIPISDFDISARIPILIVLWATILVFLRGIWHGKELFRLYEQGKIFFADNIMRIRRIGETLVLFAIIKAIGSFVVTTVLLSEEVEAPVGVTINLTALVIGLLIYVVSWVMDEGRALREEQELTI